MRSRKEAGPEVMEAPRGGGRRRAVAGGSLFVQASQEFEGSEKNSPDPEKKVQEQNDEEEQPPLPPAAITPKEALLGGAPPAPAASQVSLAVEDMRHLMTECGLGLEAVVQALLKNSGEVEVAASCLTMGNRPDGSPLWSRQDDQDLLRGEQDLRRRLERTFGAENVAKREAFRRS